MKYGTERERERERVRVCLKQFTFACMEISVQEDDQQCLFVLSRRIFEKND
jgi:hypothetical protein